MKVLVIGAGSGVGRNVVDVLVQSAGDTPIAQVRSQRDARDLEQQGIETRIVDLEEEPRAHKAAMQGADAVIFAAGSGGSKALLVDLDGAIKSMQAACELGIKRFVMVSGLGADKRERWHPAMTSYFVAKHYADEWLMHSGLAYTILRPCMLTNAAPSHRITVGYPSSRSGNTVSRTDVASVAVESLHEPNAIGKAFDFIGGGKDITEALKHL